MIGFAKQSKDLLSVCPELNAAWWRESTELDIYEGVLSCSFARLFQLPTSIHKAEFQVTCDFLIKLIFSEELYELHEPQV